MNEPNILLTGIIDFFIVLGLSGFLIWIGWKIGHRNAMKEAFEKLYSEIEKDLKKKTTPEMYAIISKKLDELDGMKHKDNDKRNDLYKRFWAKFEAKASKVMKEFEKKQLKMKV